MSVYRASQAGSLITPRVSNSSMLAGYGDFGALQRIGFAAPNNSQIVFNNIPQNFQDLMLVVYARSSNSSSSGSVEGRFNGDVGNNYSWTWFQGNGSGVFSGRGANSSLLVLGRSTGNSTTSGLFASAVTHILNYSSTSTFKTVIERGSNEEIGSGVSEIWSGLWRNTAAISSITLACPGQSNFSLGSTVALYGVRASAV